MHILKGEGVMLSWFDAREAKKFGEGLAAFFIERSPIEASKKDAKTFARKRAEVLDKMAQQVLQFRATHKLNIYKKAQLGNAFKWALRDAGYDSDYVDELTNWLSLRF